MKARSLTPLILFLTLAACSSSDGAPSTSNTSGWAGSADVFLARWNNAVTAAYKIDAFHADSDGSSVGKFLAGKVTLYKGAYSFGTQDKSVFLALCAQTAEAALGIPSDDAKALVEQAYSNERADGVTGFGMVEYQNYQVSLAGLNNMWPACTVGPKG
jgi:hypothetical protein